MPESAIRTERLTKFYGETRGIEEVTLEVQPGEVFGFLGPNGAGKTTFIRTLLDLIRPTGGRAQIFGFDTHEDSRRIRRLVGYLPGELDLYENLTGHQLIHYLSRLRGSADWGEIMDLRRRLGVDLDRRIRELSKGNKQKIGLVLAFMDRAELLILDEPTSGLDPLVQETFLELVQDVRKEGRTVFLSSHSLAEVERVCGRIAMIRGGFLAEVAPLSDLRGKAVRHVRVRFAHPVDATRFAAIPHTDDLAVREDTLTCRVQGPMDALLKACARYEVLEFDSTTASLDRIFLELYGSHHAA